MGKFLRILVIVLLLASIAALVMAHILFSRREVLRGRIITLQRGVERFASTIESEPAEPPTVRPNFPERDISPVTPEPEPSPRRAQFWTNYEVQLESLDQPRIVLNTSEKRRELMSLYRMDRVTGKPIIDSVTGAPVMDGAGTMQGLIDEVVNRAGEQYNTLTTTRQQLRVVREELVSLIEEFNTLKNDLRTEMATVVRVRAEREEQRQIAEGLRRELAQARQQIRELELRIQEMEQEELILREQIDTLQVRSEEQLALIATLQERIRALETSTTQDILGEGDVPTGGARVDIEVGEKGSVVSVDQRHLFVVMQLDEKFMQDLVDAAVQGRLPMVELLIERGEGADRTFVTKVRLTQIKQDRNLAIGDVLSDWQQMDIRVGDRVLYQ